MTVAMVKHSDCLLEAAARRADCSKSVPPPCFLIACLNFSLLTSPAINQTPTGYMTPVSDSSDTGLLMVFPVQQSAAGGLLLRTQLTFEFQV